VGRAVGEAAEQGEADVAATRAPRATVGRPAVTAEAELAAVADTAEAAAVIVAVLVRTAVTAVLVVILTVAVGGWVAGRAVRESGSHDEFSL
jgi:hypothetical protein